MATWTYNRSKGHQYVRVKARIGPGGKIRALPRDIVRHLDNLSPAAIDAWVTNYTLTVEARLPGVYLSSDPGLAGLFDLFLSYQTERKDASTVDGYRKALKDRIGPFFIEREKPLPDPATWPNETPQLLPYLQKAGVSKDNILRCNTALSKFWEWLIEEGTLPASMPPLRLRRPANANEESITPLRAILSPEDVLKWAALPHPVPARRAIELQLMALLGYFCQLRPYELFGIQRGALAAGSKAMPLECCRMLGELKLFNKFAVYVARNRKARKKRADKEKFKKPKTAVSKAWVGCFDERAARMIVALVNQLPPEDETFFEYGPRYCQQLWKDYGMPGYTLKDLQRAASYHLGHNTEFAKYPVLLQKQLRKKKMDTVLRYLRRPEETTLQGDILDLEA